MTSPPLDEKSFEETAAKALEGDTAAALGLLAGTLTSAATGHPVLGAVVGSGIKRFAAVVLESATKRLQTAERQYDDAEEQKRALASELASVLRPFLAWEASKIADLDEQLGEQFLQLVRVIQRSEAQLGALASGEFGKTRDALDELKRAVENRSRVAGADVAPLPRFEGPKGDPATTVPHFCGDREIADCQRLLGHADNLVVVQGMGGVGKTALVRELVARHGRRAFPDGCYWVDANRLSVELPRVAVRLGLKLGREPLVDEARDWIAERLTGQRVLLVLDNVAATGEILSRLPIPGGSCKVLVTTRDLTVAPQLGQRYSSIDLVPWESERARTFLRTTQPAFRDAASDTLDALTALVGGLPLALQLLSRYPFLDRDAKAADVLEVVRAAPLAAFERLEGLADVHKGGLAKTLQSGLEQLEPLDRKVLTVLGACADGARGEVVAALANIPAADAIASLNRLANASLALYGTPPAPWSLHDVIRIFALAGADGQEMAAFHDVWVFNECTRLQDPESYRDLDLLIPEAAVAVQRLLAFQLLWDASTLFERIYDHLMRRGAYALLLDLGVQLEQRLPPRSGHLAARLGNLGNCYGTIGDWQKALDYHERAMAIFTELGDGAAQATQLSNLGVCLVETGQFDEGKQRYEAALALARRMGHVEAEANSLGNLGICLLRTGFATEAIERLQAALRLNVAQGRADLQANQHNNLGNCFVHIGNLASAIQHYQEARALNEQIGHVVGQIDSRSSLARCHSLLGDHENAIQEMEAVLTLYESVDRPQARAIALLNTGQAYRAAARPEEAKKYFERAYDALDNLDDLANALDSLGTCEMRLGNIEKAISLHEEAAGMAREIGNRADEAICLEHLGRCHLFAGRLPRAIELLEQACSLSAQHGSAEAVVKQNVTLASLYALSGQKPAASQLLSMTLKKSQQQGFEMPEVTEQILMLLRICEPDDGTAGPPTPVAAAGTQDDAATRSKVRPND